MLDPSNHGAPGPPGGGRGRLGTSTSFSFGSGMSSAMGVCPSDCGVSTSGLGVQIIVRAFSQPNAVNPLRLDLMFHRPESFVISALPMAMLTLGIVILLIIIWLERFVVFARPAARLPQIPMQIDDEIWSCCFHLGILGLCGDK
jgi:hypothetical protein